VDKKLEADQSKRNELRKVYFTGDYPNVVKVIEQLEAK